MYKHVYKYLFGGNVMKKVNAEEARQVNGGRWKCKLCGKKTLTISGMHLHLAGYHAWYDGTGVSGNYSWCF